MQVVGGARLAASRPLRGLDCRSDASAGRCFRRLRLIHRMTELCTEVWIDRKACVRPIRARDRGWPPRCARPTRHSCQQVAPLRAAAWRRPGGTTTVECCPAPVLAQRHATPCSPRYALVPTNEERIARLVDMRARALLGGGAARVERQHAAGKLTARERLELLLDAASF